MYEQSAWSLSELFSGFDDPEIETVIAQINELVEKLEALRPTLTAAISFDEFAHVLNLNESLSKLFYRLYGFGMLSFSGDTQNQTAQTYLARIGQLSAEMQNRTLFFSLWWKDLDDEHAARLTAAAGPLTYWLDRIRLSKPYTLTEAEEKVINLKDVNGSTALQRLYSSITNRYVFKLTLDGVEHELTREQLSVHQRSSDPEIRKAAYTELFRVYGNDVSILGQIYQAVWRDWHSEQVEMRGYKSPLSVRNRANDIPDEVVETLLKVVRKNAPIFHRFFALKAKWLGQETLRRYDVYAPIVKATKQYSFDEAVTLVLESFNEFDPRISSLAKRVFADNHYDSENRQGKRGGAFCATLGPDYTPWVLQSYNGDPRDVATMAHELGHAIHSMLAEHHSVFTQQSSLPLAETASTFGEMLLLDKLLSSDPDPELHRDLLFSSMDDAYATIMRQAYFAIFEVESHAALQKGASIDELSDLHLSILREQFGASVDVTDDFKNEWVSIPHFLQTPFYVYAYAFGQLLALALYSQYKQEGNAIIPRYIEILAAGGSDAPAKVLSRAGIDIYAESFWQSGFDYLAEQLAQLERLPLPKTQ